MAPVSRSTACSALWAKGVRPSFIFVTFASGAGAVVHSLFDVCFVRCLSTRARFSRGGVAIPEEATGRKLQVDENDLWICAQAKERDLIVVTADRWMKRISDADCEVRLHIA